MGRGISGYAMKIGCLRDFFLAVQYLAAGVSFGQASEMIKAPKKIPDVGGSRTCCELVAGR